MDYDLDRREITTTDPEGGTVNNTYVGGRLAVSCGIWGQYIVFRP